MSTTTIKSRPIILLVVMTSKCHLANGGHCVSASDDQPQHAQLTDSLHIWFRLIMWDKCSSLLSFGCEIYTKPFDFVKQKKTSTFGTCQTPWPAYIGDTRATVNAGFWEEMAKMTLKVKVNDFHFQYHLRASQDTCLVQIWWFYLKSVTSYHTDRQIS